MTPNSSITSVTDPHTHETINEVIEFLDLYHQIILIRESCAELEQLLKRASEFEQKYKISFEQLVQIKQALMSGPGSGSGFNSHIPQGYVDIADAMRQAEIHRDVQAWERQTVLQTFQQKNPEANGHAVVFHGAGGDQSGRSDVYVFTHVRETPSSVIPRIPPLNRALQSPPRNTNVEIDIQRMSPPETALSHHQNETETKLRRLVSESTFGKSQFKITIALGLAVATIGYSNSELSSSTEGVKILRASVISSMVAFIGCLADVFLRHRNKPNAAKIVERVGFAGTIFAFTTILAGCLGLKAAVLFVFATLVTLVILIFMIMM